MKKFIPAIALTLAAAAAAPAMSANAGFSIHIGEPDFYGELDVGDFRRPPLVYTQPVIVERRYRNLAPIYLRVPPGQVKNWRRYCDAYNACARPVYFVRDDWYRRVYAPRYRELHGRDFDRRDDRRDGRRDDWRRDDRDRRDHR